MLSVFAIALYGVLNLPIRAFDKISSSESARSWLTVVETTPKQSMKANDTLLSDPVTRPYFQGTTLEYAQRSRCCTMVDWIAKYLDLNKQILNATHNYPEKKTRPTRILVP